ncbi:MAG: lipoyl synthase [Candidatus Nitrohelix vancouverensis]|uniref:Lipoyl synthase n=1 Tax=Candidatus Nitrohelix vancouverensis TaxID=2705534 RepID=A0A7T0C3Q1_9BACT|nr:MAG: lipoyl synthase [Candidatus Nitrohelix vancouverensis]
MSNASNQQPRQRKPEWLKASLPSGERYARLKRLTAQHGLHTVCESASCPNIGSCWNAGTLTLMILGDTCSRACRFCDVPTGQLQAPNLQEPDDVARMLSALDLRYAVITSVDRDDLPDLGATIWRQTIEKVRLACPDLIIETLTPDFQAKDRWIDHVCESAPHVFAHNVETTPALHRQVRPQGKYEWSLHILKRASQQFGLRTKSSMMLGLGETHDEILAVMNDLLEAGCQMLTLGQYLPPTSSHLPVKEFIHPDRFREYKELGESLGFSSVASGPLVRSSYMAENQFSAFNKSAKTNK